MFDVGGQGCFRLLCAKHVEHNAGRAYRGVQVAYHASRALLQYIRAQLVIHLTALQRRLRDGPVSSLRLCSVQHLLPPNYPSTCASEQQRWLHCNGKASGTCRGSSTERGVQKSWCLGHAVLCDHNLRPSLGVRMLHVSTGPLCTSPAAQADQHHCSSSG